jgi:phage tail sheath protein FI
MAVNLVSPGVNVREVDLTVGGITQAAQQVGAFCGPFEKGPVNQPVLVETEQDLLKYFGKPQTADGQNEYWLTASAYLSYGGVLRVVRTNSSSATLLNTAYVGVAGTVSNFRIENKEDYLTNHTDDTDWYFAAKEPGSWANNLKVCMIDNAADQIISGINTQFSTITGLATAFSVANATIGINTTIISGINTSGITLETLVQTDNTANGVAARTAIISVSGANGGTIVLETPTTNIGVVTTTLRFGSQTSFQTANQIQVGYAVTQKLNKTGIEGSNVVTYDGFIRGLVTEVGTGQISIRVTDRVDSSGVSTPIDYKNPGSSTGLNASSFDTFSTDAFYVSPSGGSPVEYSNSNFNVLDWYDQQTLGLQNSNVYWKSIAPKPGTSQFASERNSKYDELHVIVVDDTGSVTGISGNLLEKFIGISKATDSRISPSESIYYKTYIENKSNYIYSGVDHTGTSSNIVAQSGSTTVFALVTGSWSTESQNKVFNTVGKKTYSLTGGNDYSGVNNIGGYSISNADLINAYSVFQNPAEYEINYLISGPSAASLYESQAKANALIAIAESRKDCVVAISPHRDGIVNVPDAESQTNNIIEFFDPLTSSSYAIFDSGYKYTYDRFNSKFVYIPCNGDVAGLMARTAIRNYPWYSPAGSSRGALNNVVKLAYNPTQAQRDALYTRRINPIISSPGAGFILFGDKTALGYSSAFDRINVRNLFLTIEKAIERAARAQLFEFNDTVTRANFINIVEPYLRDVKGKRGITDFIVVADETNNTPDVIDSNQFRADIYIKPARSINFIGLNFIATRTGVSFSEVIGTV